MKDKDRICIIFEPNTLEINTKQYENIIPFLLKTEGFILSDIKYKIIKVLQENKKIMLIITKHNNKFETSWEYYRVLNNITIYKASEIITKNIYIFLINFIDSPNYKPKQLIFD
jgi:hypothetical protein